MKNLFLAILVCVSVISCKNTTEKAADAVQDAAEATEETVQEAVQEVAEKVESVADAVPSFSDPAVQKYVDSYEKYLEEYEKVVSDKDMSAFAGLAEKGQELGTMAQEISGKLSSEDAKRLSDYMTEKSKKIQELSAKMMQQ